MKLQLLLALLLCDGCSQVADVNTQYSRPDLKKCFKSIRIGDSVERVYDVLGSPLWIDINTNRLGDAAYHPIAAPNVSLGVIIPFATNSNNELYMTYSQPKKAGKHYLLYYVDVRDGKIFRIGGPAYMD